jgi:hypothetical protein
MWPRLHLLLQSGNLHVDCQLCFGWCFQEFYRCEVIVDLQRRLASGSTTGTAVKAASAEGTVISTATTPRADTKGAVKNAAAATAPAPAPAPAPVASDFSQLNFDHIGKKQAKSGKKAPAAGAAQPGRTATAGRGGRGASAANTTGGAAGIAQGVTAPAEEDAFKEERKRIRNIIKTFDGAITHLRALIKAGLNCLYGIQHSGVSSGSSGTGGLSCGVGASSQLLLIVDLGKDPRYISSRAGSSMLCPFHARGVYFVIESYLFPSEQYIEQQLQGAREKGLTVGATDSALLLRCCRRRHNRFGGVLGEAGHFEHLVDAYREHFTQVSVQRNMTIISC